MTIPDDVKLKLDAIDRAGCMFCGASVTVTETRNGVLIEHAAAPERGIWSSWHDRESLQVIGAENLRQYFDNKWAELHGLRERKR